MELTDEMRQVISEIDEKSGFRSSHAVIFPNQNPPVEGWPYDWDLLMENNYTKAQEHTARLASERDVTDVLIVPICKI